MWRVWDYLNGFFFVDMVRLVMCLVIFGVEFSIGYVGLRFIFMWKLYFGVVEDTVISMGRFNL